MNGFQFSIIHNVGGKNEIIDIDVIGYAYIETTETIQLILSLIDMILHLEYTQASERNKAAFPRLILKILSQLFATPVFLPALLTYQTDILSYLTHYHMKDQVGLIKHE